MLICFIVTGPVVLATLITHCAGLEKFRNRITYCSFRTIFISDHDYLMQFYKGTHTGTYDGTRKTNNCVSRFDVIGGANTSKGIFKIFV